MDPINQETTLSLSKLQQKSFAASFIQSVLNNLGYLSTPNVDIVRA